MNLLYKKKHYLMVAFSMFFVMMTAVFFSCSHTQAHAASQGMNVRYRTQQEIRSYVAANRAGMNDNFSFTTNPYVELPYDPGKLSDATQQSALNMLNQVRYIAGISDNVSINSTYCEYAQAAALINYLNGQVSHNPSRPYSMTNTMYQTALLGATSSNNSWASWGSRGLNETIVADWMGGAESTDIATLEERRYLLNPQMRQTGFGVVSGLKGTFSSAYVTDTTNTLAYETGVAWPARTMPVEYFSANYPWSFSLGHTINANDIQVILTRYRDYKTWRFSNSSADGDFYVNNNAYGQTGCIIFRPSLQSIGEYRSGDTFQVSITGAGTPISYNVEFFNLGLPKITYTVSFNSQGGSPVSPVVVSELGTINPLPSTTKANAQFLGWYTAQNGQGTKLTETTVINKNTTYYAHWSDTKALTGLSVAYNGLKYAGANVSDGLVVQANYSNGTSERVYSYSVSQRTLTTGTNRIVVSYSGVSQTIEIVVGGSSSNDVQNPTTPVPGNNDQVFYEIFFHPNGGTNLNYQKISLAAGDEIDALPTVERANYRFKGWYTKASGGRKVSKSTIPNAECVLYAQWVRITKPQRVATPSFASNENGQLKVKIDAVTGAEGYEICYSTSKDFSSNVKKVSTYYTSKTLKNLQRGKIYYIRVRAYKVDSMERKVYGKYSAIRGVKIS